MRYGWLKSIWLERKAASHLRGVAMSDEELC